VKNVTFYKNLLIICVIQQSLICDVKQWMTLSAAGDVNCSHLVVNRPKMYEQLARALSDFYETAKG